MQLDSLYSAIKKKSHFSKFNTRKTCWPQTLGSWQLCPVSVKNYGTNNGRSDSAHGEKKSYTNAFTDKLMKIFSSAHRLLFFFLLFWQYFLPVEPKNTSGTDGRKISCVEQKWGRSIECTSRHQLFYNTDLRLGPHKDFLTISVSPDMLKHF